MEIGLYTFAELPVSAGTPAVTPEQRMRNLLEEAELADQVGLDVFGVGEHHRPDFAVSSPAVALAAIAARTERIRLTSAVTVLSSDDPVRVFQDFATLDLLSGGRAEIMVGRGSFIESFPLFGYDLDDYDELFAEKLELLLELRDSERVTWSGRHRAALERRRGVSAAGSGSAAGLGGGGRIAAVDRPRRGGSGCRWRWRSSAARRSASRRWSSCTATPPRQAGHDPAGSAGGHQLAHLRRGQRPSRPRASSSPPTPG